MKSTPVRIMMAALVGLIASCGTAIAQEKKPANIKILLPENLYKPAEVRIESVLTKQTGNERTFVTPPLEAGKTYTYKVEATIEPNNYTKIIRVREVTFKA